MGGGQKFQDNWNIDAADFPSMLSNCLKPENCNLWVGQNYYPRKMITSIAERYPEKTREVFKNLYNEELDLANRLVDFSNRATELLKQMDPRDLNTYLDKRAMIGFLVFKFPDKYYLYKNKMFNDFCEITGVKEKPGRSKKGDMKILEEYSEFCDTIKQELIKDKDLISEHIKRLDYNKHYKEKEYNLLTQDFIYSVTTYLKEIPFEKYNEKTEKQMNNNSNLNLILYGPPGTGKTYKTIDLAVELITGRKSEDHSDNKKVFEELKKNKQIEFITFHQSYSYEDFIEGIKPKISEEDNLNEDETDNTAIGDIKYVRARGVFFDINSLALESYKSFFSYKPAGDNLISDTDLGNAVFYKMSLGNTLTGEDEDIYRYCIENDCIGLGWGGNLDYSNVNTEKEIRELMEKEKNEVRRYELFAVKCFKTWMQKGDIVFISNGNYACRAIGKIESDYYYKPDEKIRYHHFRKVKWLVKDANIPVNEIYGRIFSQQTIYQMFTNIIKKEFFTKLKQRKENKYDKYVLIIDEINRGNISNIFGELISLIEKDKRYGAEEALSIVLPYSKEDFTVAPNLFIIGTMNTADRSIEALDTALRRRFSFIEMSPDVSLIKNPDNFEVDLQKLIEAINNRIEILLDRDHCIGHSFFMNIHKAENPELALKETFLNNIIPLLQEYFYGNPEKIKYILGEKFVEEKFTGDNAKIWINGNIPEEIEQKSSYRIQNPLNFKDLEPFKAIYGAN